MDIRKQLKSNRATEKLSSLKSPLDSLNKQNRRRATFSAVVIGNLLLLVIFGSFLVINKSASQTVRDSLSSSPVSSTNSQVVPLDQLSSAQIAQQAAQQTGLPEVISVKNTADSEALLLSTVPNDSTILASSQIVSTAQKSRYQIIRYKTRSGDTASSIAAKYNLPTSSITESNNLSGDYVAAGTRLLIPPANGIVYKVVSGDTVTSIVNAYGADKSLFISVNDAESGVSPGEYVWIPNVGAPVVNQYSYSSSFSSYYGFGGYSPSYGFNGYDPGFCTWYVASRIAIPTNWGNANTWDDYARQTPGWVVGITPTVGSIAQSDTMSWLGHVGIVEKVKVNASGTQIIYSDMNGIRGFGAVGISDWVPATTFQHYIHH